MGIWQVLLSAVRGHLVDDHLGPDFGALVKIDDIVIG
jgi:hypothetical protein